MMISSKTVNTKIGKMWLVAYGEKLWAAEFESRWTRVAVDVSRAFDVPLLPGARHGRSQVLGTAKRALETYFRGDAKALPSVPIHLTGTELQRAVWKAVRSIRAGRTITYAKLAERVDRDGAFRAVGAANGANRCALFVPCHRVVSTSGRLVGYGGGIKAKAYLLGHEGVAVNDARLVTNNA